MGDEGLAALPHETWAQARQCQDKSERAYKESGPFHTTNGVVWDNMNGTLHSLSGALGILREVYT